ncbi:N-acylglucosamine 2-epimerase [Pseudomonas sp. ABAC61]|nr:N-acylglucosamine 2-epimerase [Pseudomonas sp. ABAC61]
MLDVSRPTPSPDSNAVFQAVHQHFHEVVVPLWLGPGWNPQLALPFEALDGEHRPLPAQRYRAMACARQLYVFSQLIGDASAPYAEARAAALFRSLQRHFHDAEHGGWFYSIDPAGAPLDRRKDLYTHAFIVFACAHYWAKVREPLVESALNAALEVVARRFAQGDGLYEACLDENWALLGTGPLQNPSMHLAEAFLATLAARDDASVQAALLELCQAMQRHFIEPQHGVMMEKPLGAVDNWFEPGHQFEWYFLLASSPLLRDSALHASLERALATQRIWAQAEYLRALTLRPDGQASLARQLQVLQDNFLHAGGWHECLDASGAVSRRDMPSTTPYHLATCYHGLASYFG